MSIKNNKGFSLIEIMVALGLLVVVGGIATTQYANYTERAKLGAVNATLGAIEKAMGVCIVDAQVTTAQCLTTSVHNTIIEKKGFRIAIETAGLNTCFYVVENDTAIGTPYTLPSAIPDKKIFGRLAYTTNDGRKVNPSIDVPAKKAGASENTGCASGEH